MKHLENVETSPLVCVPLFVDWFCEDFVLYFWNCTVNSVGEHWLVAIHCPSTKSLPWRSQVHEHNYCWLENKGGITLNLLREVYQESSRHFSVFRPFISSALPADFHCFVWMSLTQQSQVTGSLSKWEQPPAHSTLLYPPLWAPSRSNVSLHFIISDL